MDNKKYFFGNEVSNYGVENCRVDYSAFAGAFNHILCNEIATLELEIIQGDIYNEEEDTFTEIFQYFIVDSLGAELIEQYTDDILFYSSELDIYVWGVTFYGTSWSYVLTDIEL